MFGSPVLVQMLDINMMLDMLDSLQFGHQLGKQ